MKRELKRGETFKDAEGAIIVHHLTGEVTSEYAGRIHRLPSAVLDISEDEFAKDRTRWVATREELEQRMKDRIEIEQKYWASRPDKNGNTGIPEPILKAIQAAPENKMVETAPETKAEDENRAEACPECGGKIQGRGYRHAAGCTMKPKRN